MQTSNYERHESKFPWKPHNIRSSQTKPFPGEPFAHRNARTCWGIWQCQTKCQSTGFAEPSNRGKWAYFLATENLLAQNQCQAMRSSPAALDGGKTAVIKCKADTGKTKVKSSQFQSPEAVTISQTLTNSSNIPEPMNSLLSGPMSGTQMSFQKLTIRPLPTIQ